MVWFREIGHSQATKSSAIWPRPETHPIPRQWTAAARHPMSPSFLRSSLLSNPGYQLMSQKWTVCLSPKRTSRCSSHPILPISLRCGDCGNVMDVTCIEKHSLRWDIRCFIIYPFPTSMVWNFCLRFLFFYLVTALLFKMEEASLASWAKAQELIQATSQILTNTKPSASLAHPQPPAPSNHPPASYLAVPPVSYLLQRPMPVGSSGSTPTTPTGGFTSSEGRGDSEKYLKKLHIQERAVEEVKLAIKLYYQKKEITKEEYKDILRKAVHKICHSKSGEINPVKVNNLVKAYVQRYKYFRKHGQKMDEEPAPSKEVG
uniref:SFR19-like C-terminal domain-containing protein n=1 Tax=Pseudonaja textilis TaxID=8673 RepID=A0A670YZQ1_PSETE